MNAFQWIVLSILAVLILGEILEWTRRGLSRFGFVRLMAWGLAGLMVANPSISQEVAQTIGIGRGADVVLYGVSLAFVAASFYFYARDLQTREQITQLTRTIAIQNAYRHESHTDSKPGN